MADSRTASMRYLKKFQHVVDIQQKIIYFLLSIIFAFLLTYWLNSPELDQAQIYVLFLLFLSIGLWVTEAVPPFAVGLLIFGFLVFALGGYYSEIDPDNASKYVAKYVETWSNSVIWLMLGGFVMAEAMQKVGLDKSLFKMTISKFGSKPRNVLLGIMLVTAIFSMIMSNTATTAMMIAAVIPFINTLDKDSPMSKALLIGIPAAASLGGMGTIIGSPPNAIAVDAMNNHGIEFGFLEWMIIGFPVAIIMVFLFWSFLITRYVPKVSKIDLSFLDSLESKTSSRIFNIKRKIVSGVLLLTLTLWLTGNIHGIPASAVSLLPIMLLTMLGIVSGNDVRKLPWDTLMLVAGGLSLGLAIQETGLAEYYVSLLSNYDLNLYALMIVFSLLTVILSNFMSNTATTTILIPIAIILVSSNQVILPLVIGLSASAALFLPISTPPNAIAFSTGKLDQKDFRAGGLFAGLIGPTVIILMVLLISVIYVGN
ncbi:SLC13 family permease [Lutimonas saemankumensis]|uniref:SLC13 family permease n=1 Tax=Lutimonas saemankumensis TaxID=483016 RepID=UPI001CD3FEF9|nr:SLC13 family permease [Lutimonas saemankumensis]MCA0932207.1 SLC13 family permease [Lutimonas saemankumensis]